MTLSQYSHPVLTRCVVYAWPSHNTVTRSPQGVLFMHGPLTIQSPGTHKVCCLCMALTQYSHQVPTRCVVYAWPSHNTVTRSTQGVLFMHGPHTIQSPGPHKVCCLCMALSQYSHQVPTRCVVYAWPSHNTVTRSPQGVLFMHGPLTIQSPGPHKVCCVCMALSQYSHQVLTRCVVYAWSSYNTVTRSPQGVLFMHGPLTIQSPGPHKLCCLCMALLQYSHQVPTRCVVYAWPSYNTVTRSSQGVLCMHGPLTIQSPGPHKVCCLCMVLLQYSHQVPTRCVVYAWPSHNTVTRSPQGVLFMHGPLTIHSPGPHKVCCLCMALSQYSHQVPTRCVVYAWPSHNTVTRSPQGVFFMHGPLTIVTRSPQGVLFMHGPLTIVTRSPQGVLFMHGPLTIQSPGPHKVCCLCIFLLQYSHQVPTRCVVYAWPSHNIVTRSSQDVLFMHGPLTIQSPGPHKLCCLCMALSQYSHQVTTMCVVYAWPSYNSHQVTTRCVVYAWPSHKTVTRSPQVVLFMHGPLTIQSPGPHKVCCLCMALSQYSHQVPTSCVVYAWLSYNTVTRSPQGVLFMHCPRPLTIVTRSPQGVLFMHGPLTIQSPGPHKVCCLCMALSQYSHQVTTRCVVYAWPSHNTVTRSPQGVLFKHGPLTIESPGPHKVCCLCLALTQYSHQVLTRCVVYAWPSHNTVTRSPQGVLFMRGPLTIQSPGPHKVCCLCMALALSQ